MANVKYISIFSIMLDSKISISKCSKYVAVKQENERVVLAKQ
ncbi:hypothetical protein ACQKJH_08675 [Bacillus mobilis]